MIEKLRVDYQLQSFLIRYVLELRNFEIFIVVDDSGSMMTPVDETGKTRWDELREIVKRILPIAIMFDSNGVDIHFLNGAKFSRVKRIEDVEHAFARTPRDYTPLVPVLKRIFQSKMAARGRDKKLLVFVATDGKPTNDDGEDAVNELEFLMRYIRNPKTTYVSFLLCTDDPECVDYLEGWDRTMDNVDVTDDYETEKERICRYQEDDNYPFTYNDYIVKALVGSIVPYIDRLNEHKVELASNL